MISRVIEYFKTVLRPPKTISSFGYPSLPKEIPCMPQPPKAFVLNIRSKIVHTYPTQESCNVDQVPRQFRKFIGSTQGFKRCKHCFKNAA